MFGKLTSLAVLLYITIGAGYEIYLGLTTHQVKSSSLFIGLSCLIFLTRIGYALESKATKTMYADLYGAIIMLFLLILKLFL